MLKEKHPTATPADPTVFPSKEEAESYSPLPPVIITVEHIRAAARTRLKGSAGPDGIHSTEQQRWLLDYGNPSARLCAAHAASLNQRCNEAVIAWMTAGPTMFERKLLSVLPGIDITFAVLYQCQPNFDPLFRLV